MSTCTSKGTYSWTCIIYCGRNKCRRSNIYNILPNCWKWIFSSIGNRNLIFCWNWIDSKVSISSCSNTSCLNCISDCCGNTSCWDCDRRTWRTTNISAIEVKSFSSIVSRSTSDNIRRCYWTTSRNDYFCSRTIPSGKCIFIIEFNIIISTI